MKGYSLNHQKRNCKGRICKNKPLLRLTIVGGGYVGLTAALVFASEGFEVCLYDCDEERIATLQQKKAPFFEPKLQQLLNSTSLHFTSSFKEGASFGDVCFLCLPTPTDKSGNNDLSALFSFGEKLCKHHLSPLVVIKSTVLPGTADRFAKQFGMHVVSNPEFMQQGAAIQTFRYPDRVVLGFRNQEAGKTAFQLYRQLGIPKKHILCMDPISAEITKYGANVMLASRLSMINELARFSDHVGGNITAIYQGIASDPRIGNTYLTPGIGFGGSCLPKDLNAFATYSHSLDLSMPMLEAVAMTNDLLIPHFINRILHYYGKDGIQGRRLAIWGLSFKGGSDDRRGSPAQHIVCRLQDLGVETCCYDPLVPAASSASSPLAAAQGCDGVCLLTPHKEFQEVDLATLKHLLRLPVIFDGRNLLSKEEAQMLNFTYFGMGQ